MIERSFVALTTKRLEVDLQVEGEIFVEADPLACSGVLMNLLTNAIKFSHPLGKIRIVAVQEAATTTLSVSDEGIGFELSDPGILFDRFTAYKKQGTQGEPTHGLGLYLCKKIVQKHAGTISAFSEGQWQRCQLHAYSS